MVISGFYPDWHPQLHTADVTKTTAPIVYHGLTRRNLRGRTLVSCPSDLSVNTVTPLALNTQSVDTADSVIAYVQPA